MALLSHEWDTQYYDTLTTHLQETELQKGTEFLANNDIIMMVKSLKTYNNKW